MKGYQKMIPTMKLLISATTPFFLFHHFFFFGSDWISEDFTPPGQPDCSNQVDQQITNSNHDD
jgi:hypothetical protein